LSDEQFAALAETLATYHQSVETPDTETEETEQATEAASDIEEEVVEVAESAEDKVDEEVLETVQADESAALTVEADASLNSDEEVDKVRASLQNWVQTVILDNNNSESGE
jgi:aminoglycoside phosphotransferase family enzyme